MNRSLVGILFANFLLTSAIQAGAAEKTTSKKDRIMGAIMGVLIGDALGVGSHWYYDLENLKKKVDAGAEFLITQLYFDNDHYFDFIERARAIGIHVPIIPGIMPITNVAQIERFTKMCGATIPDALRKALRDRPEDPEAVVQLGVAYATTQCSELLRHDGQLLRRPVW